MNSKPFDKPLSRDYGFDCTGDKIKRKCKGGYVYDFLYDSQKSGFVSEKCYKEHSGAKACEESFKDCQPVKIDKVCYLSKEQ